MSSLRLWLSSVDLDGPSSVVLPELKAELAWMSDWNLSGLSLRWMSGLRLCLPSLSLDVSSDGVWSVAAGLEIERSIMACLAHLEWEVRACLVFGPS